KDIKDLFLGSGAGTDAYSVIEQGRVDILLQASTKERRAIFEEAAGTSRFKAKKVETLRQLERGDQKLQRLNDIIAEVEKQLRSVKLQAAKAQRAVEYNDRLRELRTAIGLHEYQEISARLQEETAVLQRLRAGLEEKARQATEWDSQIKRLEEVLHRTEETVHEYESALATARESIAAAETTLTHERALLADLQTGLSRAQIQLIDLAERVTELGSARKKAADAVLEAERDSAERCQQVAALDSELSATTARLRGLDSQVETDKAEHLEQMRQAARLQNEAASFKAQLAGLRRERERLRHKNTQATEHLSSLDSELNQLVEAEESIQRRIADTKQEWTTQKRERQELRESFEQGQQ